MNITSEKQSNSSQFTLSTMSMPSLTHNTDEQASENGRRACPNAPMLKPRNTCFKFNSTKCFMPREDMVKYTPFFYSEGEESSDDDMLDSTSDEPSYDETKIHAGF